MTTFSWRQKSVHRYFQNLTQLPVARYKDVVVLRHASYRVERFDNPSNSVQLYYPAPLLPWTPPLLHTNSTFQLSSAHFYFPPTLLLCSSPPPVLCAHFHFSSVHFHPQSALLHISPAQLHLPCHTSLCPPLTPFTFPSLPSANLRISPAPPLRFLTKLFSGFSRNTKLAKMLPCFAKFSQDQIFAISVFRESYNFRENRGIRLIKHIGTYHGF